MFPEKEKAYQERPATKAQMRKINADLKANGETVEDYAENGKLLTYAEAKEYIEGMELGMETEELKYNVSEYDLETHPYLTWEQTQKAAKSLDKEKPGWRNEQNHFNLMLEKAFQQNPQMTVRQTGRTPRVSKGGKRQRKVSSNPLSTIIFLAVVIWVVWKMASK